MTIYGKKFEEIIAFLRVVLISVSCPVMGCTVYFLLVFYNIIDWPYAIQVFDNIFGILWEVGLSAFIYIGLIMTSVVKEKLVIRHLFHF